MPFWKKAAWYDSFWTTFVINIENIANSYFRTRCTCKHGGHTTSAYLLVAVSLHMLYKLKTSKLFDETAAQRDRACRGGGNDEYDDEFPYAVHRIHVCVDSRLLCIAGNSHVVLFNFSKLDASIDCPVCSCAHDLSLSLVWGRIAHPARPCLALLSRTTS